MQDDEADDGAWSDPPLASDRGPWRLRVRLLCSVIVFAVFVSSTWSYVVEVVRLLWPPQGSVSRWATLVLLQLFGYVLLPLLVGGFVGDVVYDRFVDE